MKLIFLLLIGHHVMADFGDRISQKESEIEIGYSTDPEPSRLDVNPFKLSLHDDVRDLEETKSSEDKSLDPITDTFKRKSHIPLMPIYRRKLNKFIQKKKFDDEPIPTSTSRSSMIIEDEFSTPPRAINLNLQQHQTPQTVEDDKKIATSFASQSFNFKTKIDRNDDVQNETRQPYENLRDRVNFIKVMRRRRTKKTTTSSPNLPFLISTTTVKPKIIKRKIKRRFRDRDLRFKTDLRRNGINMKTNEGGSSPNDFQRAINRQQNEVKHQEERDTTQSNILGSTKTIIEKATLQMRKQETVHPNAGILLGSWHEKDDFKDDFRDDHKGSQGSSTSIQERVIDGFEFPTKTIDNLYREDVNMEEASAPWPLRRFEFERQELSSVRPMVSESNDIREKVPNGVSIGFVDDMAAFGEFMKGFPHGVENFQMSSLKDSLKAPALRKNKKEEFHMHHQPAKLQSMDENTTAELSSGEEQDEGQPDSGHTFAKLIGIDRQEELNLVQGGSFATLEPSSIMSSSEKQKLIPIPVFNNHEKSLEFNIESPPHSRNFDDKPHRGHVGSILLNDEGQNQYNENLNLIQEDNNIRLHHQRHRHRQPPNFSIGQPIKHQHPNLSINPSIMNTLHQQRPQFHISSIRRRPQVQAERPMLRAVRPINNRENRPSFRQFPQKRVSIPKFLRPPPPPKEDLVGSPITNVAVDVLPNNLMKPPPPRPTRRNQFNKQAKPAPNNHMSHNLIPPPMNSNPNSIFFQSPFTSPSIPTARPPLRPPFRPTRSPNFKIRSPQVQQVFPLNRNRPNQNSVPHIRSKNKNSMKSHFKVIRGSGRPLDQTSFRIHAGPFRDQLIARSKYRHLYEPYPSESQHLETIFKNMVKIEKRDKSKDMSQPLPKVIMQSRESKMPESHRSMLNSLKYGVNGEPLDVWIPIRSQEEINRSK